MVCHGRLMYAGCTVVFFLFFSPARKEGTLRVRNSSEASVKHRFCGAAHTLGRPVSPGVAFPVTLLLRRTTGASWRGKDVSVRDVWCIKILPVSSARALRAHGRILASG